MCQNLCPLGARGINPANIQNVVPMEGKQNVKRLLPFQVESQKQRAMESAVSRFNFTIPKASAFSIAQNKTAKITKEH